MALDPDNYSVLTLLERVDFSDDLAVFRLRAPDPVSFTPGQYATLGLDPGADQADVKRAYRKRVKETHPDTGDGDEEAFKEVTEAYEHLTE